MIPIEVGRIFKFFSDFWFKRFCTDLSNDIFDNVYKFGNRLNILKISQFFQKSTKGILRFPKKVFRDLIFERQI